MQSFAIKRFWANYRRLPKEVRKDALKAYRLWKLDPFVRGLQFKEVNAEQNAWSVRVGIHWRAMGWRVEADTVVWFWIGSHAEYDTLIRQMRRG